MSHFKPEDQILLKELTYKAAVSLDNFLGYTYREGLDFDSFLKKSPDQRQLLKLLQSPDFLKLMNIADE